MTRTFPWQVPYDSDGSLMHYPQRTYVRDPDAERGYRVVEPTYRPPEPFTATLTIRAGINAGRSAKYLTLIADDGRTFPMFVADFLDMALKHGIPKGGVISGRWVIRKRGQNFGVGFDGPSGWVVPCGCRDHGKNLEHLSCRSECEGKGCAHPRGSVILAASADEAKRRAGQPLSVS